MSFNLWLKVIPTDDLCRDVCVSLRAQEIQHIAQRGQNPGYEHLEDFGGAAADQGNTLLILGNRLLLIATLDISEHNLQPPDTLDLFQYIRIKEEIYGNNLKKRGH